MTETTSGVVVIGISVDYVVHLSEFYRHSAVSSDRPGKVKECLTAVGVTIIGGGISTCGTALFLFFPRIQSFFKYGTLILTTIVGSLLWSLFFFPSLLILAGPTDGCGDIWVVFGQKTTAATNNELSMVELPKPDFDFDDLDDLDEEVFGNSNKEEAGWNKQWLSLWKKLLQKGSV